MTPTLAEIYASQGLISEAISVLKQILKQEPEREDVRRRLDDLQCACVTSEGENNHVRTHPEA
jgi:aerobic-type carbon monoxide dehydrogenase small subunit (CoxS/CutS family)